MRLTKKKIFVVALSICLVAILSMGSLAWFNAENTVKNDFFFDDSDPNTPPMSPEDIFSIDVWEQYDSNGDGDFNEAEDIERADEGLSYEDVLPGTPISKIVKVENTGIHDQYVRISITVTDYAAWANILGADFDVATVLSDFDATAWVDGSRDIDTAADTVTYTLYYNGVLTPGAIVTPFTAVTIPGEQFDVDDTAAFGDDGFSISVRAQAVQTANLGDNAVEAFENAGL